jgi:hypothetical protein
MSFEHGTVSGYNYRGCRCEECRAAVRRYQQERKLLPTPDRLHGTTGGYVNYGCRCEACRRAWAAELVRLKALRTSRPVPDHVHGSDNGYTNYRCRCEPCTEAHAAWQRDYYARTESAAARGSTRGKVCKWGHDLAGDNLYLRKDGKKQCLTCVRDRLKKYRAEGRIK